MGADASSSPSYRDEVMADNPAGYWRLGETSGTTAADQTANDSRGTYKNGVVLGVLGALATDPDNAARFDGGNDMVDVPDPASGVLDFGTDDFTVEAWVRGTANDERALIGKRVPTAYWQVTLTDDPNHAGQLRANIGDGVVTRQVYSTRRVDDGNWHHVVVRFDRDTGISLYIDATPAGSGGGPMTGDLSNTANLQIGKAPGYPYLKGDIDEVALYRSLLSPARIQAHYAASISDAEAPQVSLTQPAGGSTTTDSTPTFSGTAGTATGDMTTVTVRIHPGSDTSGAPVQTLTATRAADGSYSVDAAPLASGTYTARAEQSDVSGNIGSSAPTTFTVQADEPPPPPPPDPGSSAYRDAVMADNPVGYWRLGEASGTTAADQTQNDSRGTYKNGVVLGVPGAVATSGNTAARFDGGNDLVDIPGPAGGVLNMGTSDFTAEAWVKTTANDERGLVGKGTGAGSWQVTVSDDPGKVGRLRATVNDGAVTRQAYSTLRVDDGVWHHVAVRYARDSGISFYIDGRVAGAGGGSISGPVDNAATLQIGKVPDRPYLRGDIDEVALYRSLLSPARIEAHVAASAVDNAAPLVTLEDPANGSSTNDSTPGFGGAAGSALGDSPTVTVAVHPGSDTSAPAVQTVQGQRQGDGSYTAEGSPPLSSGTYTAVARQSDLAGNVGLSAPATFTVQPGATPIPPSPVVVAAGDIAGCGGTTSGEFLTAALVEGLPDATVLTLGDNAYPNGTPSEFTNCYGPNWGRFKDRTRPVPGGHDYGTPGAAGYFGYFGAAAGDPAKGYYSYDLGAWHVVGLNAGACGVVSCAAGSPQEQWLRQDLAAHQSSCTLALMHEPRFSSGAVHGGTTDMLPFWQALYERGAEVVLSGDDHLYERFLPQTPSGQLDTANGIAQFVVGTGGYYLYDFGPPQPNSDFRLNTTYGVLKLTLNPNSYKWKFLRADGSSATDSGTASCH